MDISVVIPLYNEAESLPELEAWISRVMNQHGFTYEILFINDGSTDDSWEVINKLREHNPNIRGVSFRRNYGKSPALNTDSAAPRAMSSSQWTPTCRTAPMRFPNSTG